MSIARRIFAFVFGARSGFYNGRIGFLAAVNGIWREASRKRNLARSKKIRDDRRTQFSFLWRFSVSVLGFRTLTRKVAGSTLKKTTQKKEIPKHKNIKKKEVRGSWEITTLRLRALLNGDTGTDAMAPRGIALVGVRALCALR
jgi:hypothetical protein